MIFKKYLSAFGRRYSGYIYFIPAIVSIFYILSCTSTIETDILIPISIENLPRGLTITGPPLKGLEVRVRGSESLIASLSDMKLQYKFDLSLVDIGVQSIRIQRERILLPPGVSIVSITQSFLAVRIENEIIKGVPVIVPVSGRPAPGFIVTNAVARPPRIVLRGPEDTLKPLDKVMTKPVDVGGHFESFKKKSALELVDNVEILSEDKIFVAEISIAEMIITKMFKTIKVEGRNASCPYSITPDRIDIEIKGPINILEKIDPDKDIKICVDFKDLKPGKYVKRASIKIPVQTTLIGVRPEVFTVKVK